ncbi:MAG: septum formation initiator family protein [Flavobacteriales bacterium]
MKRKVIRFFKNKYAITTTIFVLWVCFFNDIDLFYIMKSRYQLYSLKREAKDLERKNDQAKTALEELNNNQNSLEKFARETYYMKKDNEEVFVFKERND